MIGEIFKMFGSVGLKTDEAEKGMDNIVKDAESTGSKLTGVFKKAALAVGAVFTAGKIIDFGKVAVQAAADAQAMTAQFEQVFTGFEDEAQGAIDRVAENMGALPNRLKPAFNQIASFARVNGFEVEESIGFSERAMNAASDSAAWYDQSIEQVTDTLQSYLKGNYEVADNLGILSTETTRNAKATELFGEKFKDLSGIQQQEVLLAMYEDANELSGAMGQASREADGFENVMGNLKQAWNDFLVVVGGPILKAVIPILKGITNSVVWLSEVIDPVAEQLSDWLSPLGNIKNSFIDMSKNADSSISKVIKIFEKAKVAIESVWDLITGGSTKENTDLMEQMGFSGGAIQAVLDASNLIENALAGLNDAFNLLREVATFAWNGIMDIARFAVDFYATYLMGMFDGILAWWNNNQDSIKGTVETAWNLIMQILTTVFGAIQSLFHAVWDPLTSWFNENQELIRTTVSTVWNAILTVVTWIMDNIVNNIVTGWNNLIAILQPILNFLTSAVSATMSLMLGIITAIMQAINGDWSGAWQTIKQTVTTYITQAKDSLQTILSSMWSAVKQRAKDMFDAIVEWFGQIPGKIQELWGQAQSFLEGINLWSIGESIVQGLWDGISSKWDSMVNWVSGKAAAIGDTLKGVLGINSPAKVMIPIGSALPEGVAVGVDEGWRYIEDSLDRIGNKLQRTSFSMPDGEYGSMLFEPSSYDFNTPTFESEYNYNSPIVRMLDEVVSLLENLVVKDGNIYMDSREVSKEIDQPLQEYRRVRETVNNRFKGAF